MRRWSSSLRERAYERRSLHPYCVSEGGWLRKLKRPRVDPAPIESCGRGARHAAGGGPFLGASLKVERGAAFGRMARFAGRRLARLPSMA